MVAPQRDNRVNCGFTAMSGRSSRSSSENSFACEGERVISGSWKRVSFSSYIDKSESAGRGGRECGVVEGGCVIFFLLILNYSVRKGWEGTNAAAELG